jgi:hypothetical protein
MSPPAGKTQGIEITMPSREVGEQAAAIKANAFQ